MGWGFRAEPKTGSFPAEGGFLLSERWLFQNGTVAFFERTMQNQPKDQSVNRQGKRFEGAVWDQNLTPDHLRTPCLPGVWYSRHHSEPLGLVATP